jgi:hypothetical protein
VIDRPAVQAKADMKIELLCFGKSPRTAGIKDLSRALMTVVAYILHEDIGRPKFLFRDIVASKVGLRADSLGNQVKVNMPTACQPSAIS